MTGEIIPNGNAERPVETSQTVPIVGINFGNSYASIAVFTKEGLPECIANEDGERQIACAIAFHGEEMYVGNQAIHQLVKNSQNTITGFRNLLGKKFTEVSQDKSTTSAEIIQYPDQPDVPAYKVHVLQAATARTPSTALNTPAASQAPTPCPEPMPIERILTASEVTTIFLRSLIRSAENVLGREVRDAVISVPSWFDTASRRALEQAANDAGVNVLQLIDSIGAIAAAISSPDSRTEYQDRIQLVVDLGYSSLELAVLAMRSGLACQLATASDRTIGGHRIDDKLMAFFAKDFTKKTKTPLTVRPATTPADKRAEAKLRLAVEHTKRTLSASPGAAACSVESLKDGVDFTGSINRLRFDMEVRPLYQAIVAHARDLTQRAGLDLHDIDEVVYIGGSASLPGLDQALCAELAEDVLSPFKDGTVGGGAGDPTTIVARGCAVQGKLLSSIGGRLREAFLHGSQRQHIKALAKSVGVLLPGSESPITILARETAVPAKRDAIFTLELEQSAKKIGLEVWELKEEVAVEKVASPRPDDDEDDLDEEEDEEVEIKTRVVRKQALLGSFFLDIKAAKTEKGVRKTKVEVQMLVNNDGTLYVNMREVDQVSRASLSIPAS